MKSCIISVLWDTYLLPFSPCKKVWVGAKLLGMKNTIVKIFLRNTLLLIHSEHTPNSCTYTNPCKKGFTDSILYVWKCWGAYKEKVRSRDALIRSTKSGCWLSFQWSLAFLLPYIKNILRSSTEWHLHIYNSWKKRTLVLARYSISSLAFPD